MNAVLQAANWAEKKLAGMEYGEVAVRFIVHDGFLKRVEKTVLEKDQVSSSQKVVGYANNDR